MKVQMMEAFMLGRVWFVDCWLLVELKVVVECVV
jgi:hypothetical protein